MTKEKLSNEDYEKLKVFLVSFIDWFIPKAHLSVKPEDQPLTFLANLEKKSLSNAKIGLQMAINDFVEDTSNWHPEQVAEADAKFAAAGTFTLTEVRRCYSKKYLQLLKRGVIRKETEYYLLKGILDGGGMEPGATESQQIQTMLLAFEAEVMKRLPK